MTLDNFMTPIPLSDPPPSSEDDCVMASASSTSARNLFQDSKVRLAERVQVSKLLKDTSIFTFALNPNVVNSRPTLQVSAPLLARFSAAPSHRKSCSKRWEYWPLIGPLTGNTERWLVVAGAEPGELRGCGGVERGEPGQAAGGGGAAAEPAPVRPH